MNGTTNPPISKRQATRVLLLVALLAMCGLCALAGGDVTIKGQLVTADNDFSDANVYLILPDTMEVLPLKANGRYSFRLSTDSDALLRFEKDGCISKEVKVHTKNIFASSKAKKKNRVLRFNVELMPMNFGRELAFESPVGKITFLNGSGLMRVDHMYSLKDICDLKGRDGEGLASCQ